MGYQIDIAVSGTGRLGEGLVWDDEDQLLWWVDITGGLIHSYDISSRSNTSYDFGEPVGSIGRREAGGLVVAAKSGFYFFDGAFQICLSFYNVLVLFLLVINEINFFCLFRCPDRLYPFLSQSFLVSFSIIHSLLIWLAFSFQLINLKNSSQEEA